MKRIITLGLLMVFTLCFAQKNNKKWYLSSEVDIIFSNRKSYFFNDESNKIFNLDLEQNGFLLNSFGLQGDINYMLFRKFSFGVVVGFQTQSKPKYSTIKLGGVLRYFFVDKNNVYIFLQDANNFSLDRSNFLNGNNFRVGLGIPIIKLDKYNIIASIFNEQNYYKLEGTPPLLNLTGERPRSLTVKSFGISLGLKLL